MANFGFKKILLIAVCTVLLGIFTSSSVDAQERAYGQRWGSAYSQYNWNRFYHYPYVYYPQNYRGQEYYRSYESMYHRYPQEMRTPVYNKQWHNFYPQERRYHWGHHFRMDVF